MPGLGHYATIHTKSLQNQPHTLTHRVSELQKQTLENKCASATSTPLCQPGSCQVHVKRLDEGRQITAVILQVFLFLPPRGESAEVMFLNHRYKV